MTQQLDFVEVPGLPDGGVQLLGCPLSTGKELWVGYDCISDAR